MIGHSYTADGATDKAREIFERGLKESKGKPGYKAAVDLAELSLFQLHLGAGRVFHAIPYTRPLFRHFPIMLFLKTHKFTVLTVLLALAGCLWVWGSTVNGRFLGIVHSWALGSGSHANGGELGEL